MLFVLDNVKLLIVLSGSSYNKKMSSWKPTFCHRVGINCGHLIKDLFT